jgi:hypothetical protein
VLGEHATGDTPGKTTWVAGNPAALL